MLGTGRSPWGLGSVQPWAAPSCLVQSERVYIAVDKTNNCNAVTSNKMVTINSIFQTYREKKKLEKMITIEKTKNVQFYKNVPI